MVASGAFAEFLRDQIAPVGHITMRRMFGKTGVFCDGVMLGMVTENIRCRGARQIILIGAASPSPDGQIPACSIRS
jgi:TfoX/Sxy family transcriptional regulator of competence genes